MRVLAAATLLIACSGARFTSRRSAAATPSKLTSLATGQNLELWTDGGDIEGKGTFKNLDGTFTWGAEVPGLGVALCDEPGSNVAVLQHPLGEADSVIQRVSLAPLSNPVGAVFFDGLLYVACFGGDTTPGIAVVDPFKAELVSTHEFPSATKAFVHNVYVFNWNGQPEVFAAVLGNPWASPPLPGSGLVRFDRESGKFSTDTTVGGLNARSAVQQSDDVFYVLTQEPGGAPTKLARLEKNSVGALEVVADTRLAARAWGDGGADVILGLEADTVFATDRTDGNGKLYFYTYTQRAFELGATRETGLNPRFTTMDRTTGDVVACNNWDATLSVFVGLGKNPTAENLETHVIPTVNSVSFFMKV